MTNKYIVRCDHCGKEVNAGEGWSKLVGWFEVEEHEPNTRLDFCCESCLKKWAVENSED